MPVNLNEILFWAEREDSESDEMSSRDVCRTACKVDTSRTYHNSMAGSMRNAYLFIVKI